MGIRTDISAEAPLSDDDRDILAGVSARMFAIADGKNLPDQLHMQDEEELQRCGDQRSGGQVCDREEGHSGHHSTGPSMGW